ncbi:ABC transporter ATP-binding protein [Embleya sp. NPDC020886]|uniref:ABC transporter ATP-binding protein n=1 Tax=Embleya sp. NPDC020886 TaxID=3363980 RepID=UPI003791059E
MLEIKNLRVRLRVEGEQRTVIHDASLTIGAGEAFGLIGESGSGKSMTARAVARLLPEGAECIGEIAFDGKAVLALPADELRQYRAADVAMIFQDPRASINPVRTVGDFLTEGARTNFGMRRREAEDKAVALLAEVGIADGGRRLRQHPHQLSGGLLQRVMIASALMGDPKLLLADEPTTALDVTTQSEVMGILHRLRADHGVAMLFITHDLELAGAVCDRIGVMYAGSIVETLSSAELHETARHPYTRGLLTSRPSLTATARRLPVIAGKPLSAFEVEDGCAFEPRCPHAIAQCRETAPDFVDGVRCHRAGELS